MKLILIFIGIFLLILGIFYFSYREGFDTGSTGTGGSFCSAQTQCTANCWSKYNPDPNALPPETADEKNVYDAYDYYNMQDLRIGIPSQTTFAQKSTAASSLSAFDEATIPWDYDNSTLDPQLALWGSVSPEASQAIFTKAYVVSTLGSANSADFIQSDPTTGQNSYTSPLFHLTVPSGTASYALQLLDGFSNLYLMIQTQTWFGSLTNHDGLHREKAILKEWSDPKNAALTYEEITTAFDRRAITQTQIIANSLSAKEMSFLLKDPRYTADGIVLNTAGKDVFTSRANLIKNTAKQLQGSTDKNVKNIVKNYFKTGDETLHSFKTSSLRNKPIINNISNLTKAEEIESRLAGKNITRAETGEVRSVAGRAFRLGIKDMASAVSSVFSSGAIGQRVRSQVALFARNNLSILASAIVPAEVLGIYCSSLSEQAVGAAIATVSTGGISAIASAAITTQATACWTVYGLLHAFFISCYTWIPAILGAIVDPSCAQCPADHEFNLYEAIVNKENPNGYLEWSIIAGIPEIGAVVAGFAEYACWSKNLEPVLIEPINPPFYYFDPTLSLFTVEKTYSTVYDSQKAEEIIANGMVPSNPAYYDPALYKDPNGNYPIWVDYSNTLMLDKMAQFYYDTSRKNMTVLSDGTATFEYISRFYGIISSSELSCDVQCEISQITVDVMRGTKLCEQIVPPDPNSPCTYHDRRFYWSINISAGINLQSDASDECGQCYKKLQGNTGKLDDSDPCAKILNVNTMYDANGQPINDHISDAQASCATIYLMNSPKVNPRKNWDSMTRMKDNMTKFFVTGCTCIDGTGIDAVDVSNQMNEGTQIGNSVVALGTPGGEYYPPVVGSIISPGDPIPPQAQLLPPDSDVCAVTRRAFLTYGTTTIGGGKEMIDTQEQINIPGVILPSDFNSGSGSGSGSGFGAILKRASSTMPWTFQPTKNDGNPLTTPPGPSTPITSAAYEGSAKYLAILWTGCPSSGPASVNCHLREKWASILYNTVVGGLAMVPIPGLSHSTQHAIQTGSIIYMTAEGVLVGLNSVLDCATEEIQKQTGTFLLNGMIVTSQNTPNLTNFIMFQGPIMPFSPGYAPKIIYTNTPPLTFYNCVNRYTVRYFTKTFSEKYKDLRLNKILNIAPRVETPSCVFNFQYTNPAGKTETDYLALQMRIQGYGKDLTNPGQDKNTYVYQPVSNFLRSVPVAIPFQQNSTPLYTNDTFPKGLSSLLPLPDPYLCSGILQCSNVDLQARLISQFNKNHLGVSIDSIKESYTPDPILNNNLMSCVFQVQLSKFIPTPQANPPNANDDKVSFNTYDIDTTNENAIIDIPGNFDTQTTVVTMFLKSVSNPTGGSNGPNGTKDTCLYDLAYDDYPVQLWYKPIPVLYFDVPPLPVSMNTNFSSQTGVSNCAIDCSGAVLMQRLVTQFNTRNTDKKISTVLRSYTPLLSPSAPVCDYAVEMVRTKLGTTIAHMETVRFYLKPTPTPSCMFDLDRDDSDRVNSGLSLNNSTTTGGLKKSTPGGTVSTNFSWSSSFIEETDKTLTGYLQQMMQFDGINTINKISATALNTINTLISAANLSQTLSVCPQTKCNDPYVLQKILNRFNFDNYPRYPGGQYESDKTSIIQFRKAGISGPTQCQVELVKRIKTYKDLLYEDIDITVPYNGASLQQWTFDFVPGTSPCKFTVKDISGADLSGNKMDITANPYAIQSPISNVIDLVQQPVYDPITGQQIQLFSYQEPMINCGDPEILNNIITMYNAINVARPRDSALGIKQFNKIPSSNKFMISFNPRPNICEYKVHAIHKYYDENYDWYYTVPEIPKKGNPIFSDNDYTFIIAEWLTGSQYDIETGNLLDKKPNSIKEVHLADLKLIQGKFYMEDGTGPVDLPYIAGIGYDPSTVDTTKPRFKVLN